MDFFDRKSTKSIPYNLARSYPLTLGSKVLQTKNFVLQTKIFSALQKYQTDLRKP